MPARVEVAVEEAETKERKLEKVEVPRSPLIVVVAVLPTVRGPKVEKIEEEAFPLNCCRAVHVLAFAVFKEAAPFAYERPPVKVVVEVQVGTPAKRAKICPGVPCVVVESCEPPFPYGMVPD